MERRERTYGEDQIQFLALGDFKNIQTGKWARTMCREVTQRKLCGEEQVFLSWLRPSGETDIHLRTGVVPRDCRASGAEVRRASPPEKTVCAEIRE